MREDPERDPVEDALLQMGQFDEREAAIERAESEGIVAEVPELSSAKIDAIVAASLEAAAPESEVEPSPNPATPPRSWIPWACGAAVAIAAALVLWQSPPSADEAAAEHTPLPSAQLRLGGTARTLGDSPALRSYGPGDAFFVELSFDTAPASPIVAEVFASDGEGVRKFVPLPLHKRADAFVFEGEIAALLPPGIWTLQIRYGDSDGCAPPLPDDCETLETRIKVVGP